MSHPTKRVRVDTAAVATAQYYNTTGTVPSSFQLSADLSYLITTQPNCTIAAFELPPECSEIDINDAFMRCGQVKSLQKVCGGRAALIEFPEISTPTRLVHWAKINPFFIGVYPVRLEFSSQTVTNPANLTRQPLAENNMATDTNPNNVLHLDITSAEYPITVDVLKKICSRHGTLQRIFIGKVNVDKSLEALVEFATVEEAKQAREHLDGADIYSGCCSLTVTFSKMKKIHVTKNDTEQWDFSDAKEGLLSSAPGQRTLLPSANGHTEPPKPPQPPVMPGQPPQGPPVPPMGYQQPYYSYSAPPGQYMQPPGYYPPMPMPGYGNPGMPYGMQPPMPPYYQHPGYQYYPQHNQPQQQQQQQQMQPQLQQTTVRTTPQIIPTPAPVHHVTPAGIGIGHSTSNLNSTSVAAARNTDMSIFRSERGACLVVSNLPETINCDHLFNIICLYGNIARIKFLKSRPGCAIVQMGSKDAADLVLQNLESSSVFGQAVHFHNSEQPELQEHAGLGTLKDGSPVMKNYMADSNNRFRNAVVAAKSRILAPTRTLHFFNAPLNFTPEDMCRVFHDCGVKRPPRIVVFTAKPGQKTSLGLAEWDTLGESLDALALSNHRPIHIVGFAHPFHLKLAFSPKPISDDRVGQSMINYPAPPMQISRGPQLNAQPRAYTITTAESPSPPAVKQKEESPKKSPVGETSPFDVRAVEAEEDNYLKNHLGKSPQSGQKRARTPSPVREESDHEEQEVNQYHRHQPPKTPEEEEDDEEEEDRGVYEKSIGDKARSNSSGLSDEEREDVVPHMARKMVHQPPTTPPSEPPSSPDED